MQHVESHENILYFKRVKFTILKLFLRLNSALFTDGILQTFAVSDGYDPQFEHHAKFGPVIKIKAKQTAIKHATEYILKHMRVLQFRYFIIVYFI